MTPNFNSHTGPRRRDLPPALAVSPRFRQLELFPPAPPRALRRWLAEGEPNVAVPVPLFGSFSTAFLRHRLDSGWWSGSRSQWSWALMDRIGQYRPDSMSEASWREIEPIAKGWVAIAAAEDPNQAPRMLTATAMLLEWCHRSGLALQPEVVLYVDTIEQFIAEGLSGRKPGSKRTYRSLLRTVGERVLGPEACPSRQQILSRTDPERPYAAREVADLIGAVRGLTTPHRRDNGMVVLMAGLGAGLANADLAGLVGSDVDDTGDVLAINVTFGPRRRRTVVLAEWEEEVRRRAEEVGDRPMFHPARTTIRDKDIPNFLDRLSFPYLPRLTLQRLRVTWIVHRLSAGVPVHVVAGAAGVGEQQIARYSRFLPEVSQTEADHLLRGQPTP